MSASFSRKEDGPVEKVLGRTFACPTLEDTIHNQQGEEYPSDSDKIFSQES